MENKIKEQKIKRVTIVMLLLLLISLFTLGARAECDGMLYIEKGMTAPCSGYLIDESVEEYFNDLYEENEFLNETLTVTRQMLDETYKAWEACQNQLLLCEDTVEKIDRGNRAANVRRNLTYLGVGVLLGIVVHNYVK